MNTSTPTPAAVDDGDVTLADWFSTLARAAKSFGRVAAPTPKPADPYQEALREYAEVMGDVARDNGWYDEKEQDIDFGDDE